MANGQFNMASLLPIMQAMSQYAPQVTQPGMPVGTPQPQSAPVGVNPYATPQGQGGTLLSSLSNNIAAARMKQAQGMNQTLTGIDPSLSADVAKAQQYAQDAMLEYEDASRSILPGKLGVYEGLVRNFTSKDERARAIDAVRDAQEMHRLADEDMRKRQSLGAYTLMAPILGQQQAGVLANMAMNNPKYMDKILDDYFQKTDPPTVQKQVDYVMGLPEGEAKDLAMQILLKNANQWGLSFDPKTGRFLVTQGGDITASMPTNVTATEQEIFNTEDAMAEMNAMKEQFNPNYFGLPGAVVGAVGGAADYLGLDIFNDAQEFAAEREAFIKDNMRFVDVYRHQVTGAQASAAELERIENRLMNASKQGKKAWMVAFNSVMKEQHAKMNRHLRRNRLPFEGELPVNNYIMFSRDEIYGSPEVEGAEEPEVELTPDEEREAKKAELRQRAGLG